ncbi:MAG: DegT/DnrJ/EryC1/StrS family aminotransferase [Acidobacteria bacterium]|nr:DegT/DnrJ/EryC1/StrS family aminotransferase [Acidobacteriota bacterium]
MPIPVANLKPSLEATASEWQARLAEMFERGQFILGPQVAAFEREFAAAMGARQALGVGTGTAALELALRAAGVSGEVLTTPLTALFTGIAILTAGARPRFADIDPETLQLDPDDAGNRAGKKTAALLPVHLYGQPCRIDRFSRLARALGVPLVQDACQAHGAHFLGRPLTDFSPLVAYSFYPTKNLGCLGDGGAIATRSAAMARRLLLLRDGGRQGGQVSHAFGINSRLDEMQCCYLRAFLPHLADWTAQRARLASVYDQALADCPGVRLVKRYPCSVHHLYVIRAQRRDRLREHLAGKGVGTAIHYPVPLHLQPTFRDCGARRGDLPQAEKACREIVSLPLWPYMRESAALEVAGRIREFYQAKR